MTPRTVVSLPAKQCWGWDTKIRHRKAHEHCAFHSGSPQEKTRIGYASARHVLRAVPIRSLKRLWVSIRQDNIKEMAPPKAGFSEELQQNKSIHHQPPMPYFRGVSDFSNHQPCDQTCTWTGHENSWLRTMESQESHSCCPSLRHEPPANKDFIHILFPFTNKPSEGPSVMISF